ncbi:unnamed protein product [Diabrotica balteata]|uniref:Ig-like domain-containing protein n=1 Tax=Diabrotica balteata TaxID=107213 RepID=A0A9N9T5C8_DIABA|nr:unnamed protein product [Diabrotica balteata]
MAEENLTFTEARNLNKTSYASTLKINNKFQALSHLSEEEFPPLPTRRPNIKNPRQPFSSQSTSSTNVQRGRNHNASTQIESGNKKRKATSPIQISNPPPMFPFNFGPEKPINMPSRDNFESDMSDEFIKGFFTVFQKVLSEVKSFEELSTIDDWTLQIKFVQQRDAGLYECQVSSHPPISIFIQLNVVDAKGEIQGPLEKYLKPGSGLRLQCTILQSTEPPSYVFWYHNNRMINYDADQGINVTTDLSEKMSILTITNAATRHSGNYSCVPSNAQPASTYVHILNGKST